MATPRETLPEDYRIVIAEIEGRYYPLFVEKREEDGTVRLGYSPNLDWRAEAQHGVPPALGPRHMEGKISFRTYRAAFDFCHRMNEGYGLPCDWNELTAQTELYPERNAWYRDEIVALVNVRPLVETSSSSAYGSVFPRGGAHCFVTAPTIDEAWVRLYASVCEYIARKQSA